MDRVHVVFKKYLNHWAIDRVCRKQDKAFARAAKIKEEQEESKTGVIGSYVESHNMEDD